MLHWQQAWNELERRIRQEDQSQVKEHKIDWVWTSNKRVDGVQVADAVQLVDTALLADTGLVVFGRKEEDDRLAEVRSLQMPVASWEAEVID